MIAVGLAQRDAQVQRCMSPHRGVVLLGTGATERTRDDLATVHVNSSAARFDLAHEHPVDLVMGVLHEADRGAVERPRWCVWWRVPPTATAGPGRDTSDGDETRPDELRGWEAVVSSSKN